MDWDPLSPAVTGLAWPVTRQGGVRLDSHARGGAGLLPSTAAESVTAVHLRFRDVVGSATYRWAVFDAGDLPNGSPQTVVFSPNEDGPAMSGCTGSPVNTAGSLHTNIDELTLGTSDYVDLTASSAVLDLRCASAAGLGAGSQTVMSVRVKCVAEGLQSTSSIAGFLTIGGTRYTGEELAISSADGRQTMEWEWLANPSTGSEWTETEIQAFDATNAFGLSSPLAADERVYQAWLEVDYVDGAALSQADATISSDGWGTFTPAAGWPKAAGTDYLWLCRRVGGSGAATLVALDSGETIPGGHVSYRPTIVPQGAVISLGDARTETHPIILEVGGSASVDSQPYASLRAVDVVSGVTVTQEITAPSTATRRWVRLVARSQHPDGPSDPLVATISGQTAEFTGLDVADAPLAWHVLDGVLSAGVSWTSGTQYDVALTCAAEDGRGWQVAVLDSDTPPVSADTAGFGGVTDRGDTGTGESDNLDVPLVVGTVPSAPTGFTATGGNAQTALAWTATALGASFGRYELLIEQDGEWHMCATIGVEATASFTSRVGRIGVQETWGIRVRHTNGTVSVIASDTATATSSTGLMVLASDETGTSTEVEIDYAPEVAFARDRGVSTRMGRRYPAVTEAPHDRGVSLSGVLTVLPANEGIQGWDDLRALMDADVTAYALLTPWGDRHWVHLIVDGGTLTMPGFLPAPIQLVETRGTPPLVAA